MLKILVSTLALAHAAAFASAPCELAAKEVSKGILKSMKVQNPEWDVRLLESAYKGLDLSNGAAPQYTFTFSLRNTIIDYKAVFDVDYCSVESLNVVEFGG